MIRFLFPALICAAPAMASDLPAAPEYFLEAAIAATASQQIADSCSTLKTNPASFQAASEAVLVRLTEDGFDPTADDLGMADPSEEFHRRQMAFIEKHALGADLTEAKICAAGRAEMAEKSAIGLYLIDAE